MKPQMDMCQGGGSAWEVQHPLTAQDERVVAGLRTAMAAFKGKGGGPEARAFYDEFLGHTPAAADVSYEAGVVGGIHGFWCRPRAKRSGAAILYLHGGAYVLGSAHAYRQFVGQIAARANTAAFVPDYRLAPEHAFPAALDDAKAVYRGLVEQGSWRVVLAGDSAGGGLALVLLSIAELEARAQQGVAPCGAAVMSPWTDLALTGRSLEERANDEALLTVDMLAKAAASYLQSQDARNPLVSPLYGHLAGLPAIQLHVGTSEILLDDSRRYAERARADGVDVRVHVWEGMTHVFPLSVGTLDASGLALDLVAAFLDEALEARARVE